MGCATATIKYLVFIFNVLCALLGISVVIVDSIALKDVAEETRPLVIFFIVLGSIVFVISFFGCCGAIKQSPCMIWLYATFMLILLVLTCVLTFAYVNRVDETQVAREQLNDTWAKQTNTSDPMGFCQSNLKCCGITGPIDYTKSNLIIPASCYANNSTSTGPNHTVFPDGCLVKLADFYHQAMHLVKIFGWIFISVEACAFVCATILGIHFNNDQRRSRY